MRPRLAGLRLLAALVALLVATAALGGVAAAQGVAPENDPDGDVSTNDQPVPGNDIIPEPDSGVAPTDAGDRGGALQLTVFVAILAGIGAIVALAVRESRKARRARGDRLGGGIRAG
jgi:hypothetical protein